MNTRRNLILLCLTLLLTSCTGIPIRSLPRLVRLQSGILQANPAELMVALQVDARMVPSEGASPLLLLTIKPTEPGSFAMVDQKLPMYFTTTSSGTLGLTPPVAGRRWLIYSLTQESQTELLRIREAFKQIQASGSKNRGGTISVGIAQDGVAARDPALAHTEWSTWLQTSRQEGFFELWSGTVADVLKQANRRRD